MLVVEGRIFNVELSIFDKNMNEAITVLGAYSDCSIPVLDGTLGSQNYVLLDLSTSNQEISEIDIADPIQCQDYIDAKLNKRGAAIAYGGYLEKRKLYSDKPEFTNDGLTRNIHLGMDFWAGAGTNVLSPLSGKVHSFKNNSKHGDYGPTIILEHELEKLKFYTLYGHLSVGSLDGLYQGKQFHQEEILGSLGSPEENVGYAPHLHFQLILDMQGNYGDYPGVCSEQDLDYYSKNCPDPNLLLKIYN